MKDFKKLQIWQRSHQITLSIYKVSAKFPREEVYGLTSQIRRCSFSVPSNIAEGCGRNSDAELSRFLVIASGSAFELSYQLLLAKDLNYVSENVFLPLDAEITEVSKMINSFIQKLKPNDK